MNIKVIIFFIYHYPGQHNEKMLDDILKYNPCLNKRENQFLK